MQHSLATVGGGCFWCIEAIFKRIEGVVKVQSGYSGGTKETADYSIVKQGKTDHAEVVQITYDEQKLPYLDLLKVFFHAHDPTTQDRQGADIGHQYRSVVFYHTPQQKATVLDLIEQMKNSNYYKLPIVTQVVEFKEFFSSENYHHDYYDLNPTQGYCKAVIQPKVEKIVKEFNEKLKSEYKS